MSKEKSWFEEIYKINERIEKLESLYTPESPAFDEISWTKEIRKLKKKRQELVRGESK